MKQNNNQALKIFVSVPHFSFDPVKDAEILTLSAIARAALRDGKEMSIIPFQGQPGLFLTEPAVVKALEDDGDAALPITLRGSELLLQGRAPSADELFNWLDLGPVEVDLRREAMIQRELSELKSGGCGSACGSQGCVSCPGCADAFLADEQALDF
ncbi:MAG: arsenic metallochaperone ArsD family protein [Eubacteriales bacterium]|nr:arsenic metallochaperone ArsD family protein [Eubacteriales bacterium]